jgi:PKD repeat protein
VDDRYPEPYRGAYFFADHNRAALLALPPGGGEAVEFATNAIAPVQVSRAYEGDLFMLSFVDGALIRIRYAGGDNVAPLAQAAAEPASGPLPLAVSFSAEGSRDPDGGDLSYLWEFGDGQRSTEANPAHTYVQAGRYEVRLTVSDGEGAAAATTLNIDAGSGAPAARILAPAPGAAFGDGDTVAFSGAAEDPEEGALPPAALAWAATLHHNDHVHTDYYAGTGAEGAFAYAAHGENVWMELCLTATDSDGVEGRECVDLRLGDTAAGAMDTVEPEAAPAAAQNADARTPPAAKPAAAPGNGVRQEIWNNLGGGTMADLAGRGGEPDEVHVIAALDTAGQGKDYGEVLRARLTAPVDGAVQFWIAGDDAAELWLSPDADAAHAVLIARVDAWTPRYAWDRALAQASAPVVLEAGKDYAIEVRHKQADGKDNVAVAWLLPGGARELIPSSALTPTE